MSIGQELASNSRKTGVPKRCPNPDAVQVVDDSSLDYIQLQCTDRNEQICINCVFNSGRGQSTQSFEKKDENFFLSRRV